MNTGIVHIMEEEWDYLILLDACRYDYFEKIYPKFFAGGQLSCRKSVGGCTKEWRDRSFPGRYEEVVYVSSNPYINSRKAVEGFWGKEHFHQVIDVWQSGWKSDSGTVPPQIVTEEALRAIQIWPAKRVLIHYLQPHAPYLGFGSDCAGFPRPDIEKENVLRGTVCRQRPARIRGKIYWKLHHWVKTKRIFGNHPDWLLAHLLALPPLSPMDAVRRRYGKKGLRRAYQENLEIVLKEVARLLPYLKGKIVVTSDHGELLGEGGSYSHEPNSENPFLRNIPWWTMDKQSACPLPAMTEEPAMPVPPEEETVEKRLKDLGYL